MAGRPVLRAVRVKGARHHELPQPSSPSPSPSSSCSPPSPSSRSPGARDVRGAGALSARPRRRDRAGREAQPSRPATSRRAGGDVEAARPRLAARRRRTSSRAERRAGAVDRRPIPRRSASPAASSSTAPVTLMSVGLGGFARPASSPSCGRRHGRLRRQVTVGKLDDIIAGIARGRRLLLLPEARTWITEYPADAAAEGRGRLRRSAAHRHGARASSRCTRSARTSVAVCPQCVTSQWFECPCHGSQYNRVGEKKAGPRRAAWTASRSRSPPRRRHHRHRHRSSPARRSAPTPPARRPRVRTASPVAGEH